MRRGHPCSGLSKIATRRRPTRHWFLANTKCVLLPVRSHLIPLPARLLHQQHIQRLLASSHRHCRRAVSSRRGWLEERAGQRCECILLTCTPRFRAAPAACKHTAWTTPLFILFILLILLISTCSPPSFPPHSIRRTLLPLPCVSPSPSALYRHLEPPPFSLLPPLRPPLPAKPAARAGSWSPPSTPATRCCDSAGRWCPLF